MPHNIKPKKKMKKSILQTIVLAALLALPTFAKAQTFAGITAEQSAQNTPEGWTAVALPQLPAITSANTIDLTGKLSATADNTVAIQAALDQVPSTGGMVIIPKGTWLFGDGNATKKNLIIKSKTILHLAAGCTLKLQPYGTALNNKTNFITCVKNSNTSDIVIEGEDETSVIDGQGARWWLARENGETFNPGAMIRFEKGKRFLIRNLKIQNTPGVNITISNSNGANNATIHDVTISEPASEAGKGKASHNTDGISIWGPYVNIYNCNISNGDDNVVCDNDAQYIHVWDCNFGTGHGASIGSYTKNIKHVWFDQINMNGTTAGVRLKTGINSDGTLRGGGEEDFKFTNITMTKVANPFSMDCYYDKKYNADPAVDKANARALDGTTPTYNGVLLQNIKTTDVCSGNAIFLVGRPESHIKNVTLDNVQINAKKGIDIRFVDNLVFKNGSKITVSNNGTMWVKNFDSTVDDLCDATKTSITPTPTPGEDGSVTYTLDKTTCTASSTGTEWSFNNGCSISNSSKNYQAANLNTIKYSKGTQFTIKLPTNVSITSVTFAGYANEDLKTCYLGELNGTTYTDGTYVFPSRKPEGATDASYSTSTKFTVNLSTPAIGTLTFTPQGAQAAWIITLKGTYSTTGIDKVTSSTSEFVKTEYYSLNGIQINTPQKGINIRKTYYRDGTVRTDKIIL